MKGTRFLLFFIYSLHFCPESLEILLINELEILLCLFQLIFKGRDCSCGLRNLLFLKLTGHKIPCLYYPAWVWAWVLGARHGTSAFRGGKSEAPGLIPSLTLLLSLYRSNFLTCIISLWRISSKTSCQTGLLVKSSLNFWEVLFLLHFCRIILLDYSIASKISWVQFQTTTMKWIS